ncbi:hypothetical protein CFP71_14640 [Amycolatopsis thailandensis]|uniref:Abortive phage infection protein C-terminal domain-containing protein n=1 Tax=Amycolatopsis thailandensis TaxID=589330 RepID=A0A229SB31_9PSEU|nr:AIPR family protein [Amycolatopsis thailandensis]OXM56070.1 hypothetical protein CFP71_14640 [Amycolatopsis thailandensis]
MSKFHVDQIETHIKTLYKAKLWKPGIDDVANLSRLLAYHAVQLLLGTGEDAERLIEITDGGHDEGIDAVGVDPAAKMVVFVQSKWRQDGKGSMQLGDVLKFLQGVKSILGMKGDEKPAHASEKTRAAVGALLTTPGAKIRLVTVTTASEPLADAVTAPIVELLGQLDDLEDTEPLAGHDHLAQANLFRAITDRQRTSINLNVQILDWGKAADPHRIFYGRVSAADIATWFTDHGADLFADNIRVVIPRSDINDGILKTVKGAPQLFMYYNNGITVLAETIAIAPGGTLNRDVGYFTLTGASIVNGAQTVSTLGSVKGTDAEQNLGQVSVMVRCIEVPKEQDDLAQQITRFANTQNEVSSQDFAFLDKEQHRLVRELEVIGYEYILRSAEVPRSKDPRRVIELRQAAVALACAAPNIGHAVLAKREVSRLFTDQSVYRALFNPSTDPIRLSRAVAIVSGVDGALDIVGNQTGGVYSGIAVHGRRVIAHLIMRALGDVLLADPQADFMKIERDVPAKASEHAAAIAKVFPSNAYPGNVFKNQSRVVALVAEAGLADKARR